MFSLCCVPQANWPSSFKKLFCQLEVVVHSFYPSTWEAEMGRSLWVDGKPGVQIEFQGSQDWWHSHKTIPHQFRIMNSKRVIYLREKRTGHCPIYQASAWTGTEPNSQKREPEAREQAHIHCCFYSIRDYGQVGWYLTGYWLKEQNVLPQHRTVTERNPAWGQKEKFSCLTP